MKHLRFILAIILMLVVVVILVQNHETMSTQVEFRVDLLTLQLRSSMLSLYYVVIITFLFGILISGLYGILERFRLKKQLKMVTKQLKDKDLELNSLRNLPITSDDVNPGQTGNDL